MKLRGRDAQRPPAAEPGGHQRASAAACCSSRLARLLRRRRTMRSRWRCRSTRCPPAISQARCAAGGDGEDPVDGGRVGRVAVDRRASAAGPAGRRPAGRRSSARASVGSRPAAPASARASVVGEHVSAVRTSRADDVAAGDRRPSAAAARGGRGCGRSGGRRSTGRRPATSPRSAHSRRGLVRGAGRAAAGSGRAPSRASPSSPAPRSRLMSIVSARSSAVWPVSAPAGRAARRAARARASRFGAGGDVEPRRAGTARRACAARSPRPVGLGAPTTAGGRGRRGSP